MKMWAELLTLQPWDAAVIAIAAAFAALGKSGIDIFFMNACLDIWLYLHYQEVQITPLLKDICSKSAAFSVIQFHVVPICLTLSYHFTGGKKYDSGGHC